MHTLLFGQNKSLEDMVQNKCLIFFSFVFGYIEYVSIFCFQIGMRRFDSQGKSYTGGRKRYETIAPVRRGARISSI